MILFLVVLHSGKIAIFSLMMKKANFQTKLPCTTKYALRLQKLQKLQKSADLATFEPKVADKFLFLPSISITQNQLVF